MRLAKDSPCNREDPNLGPQSSYKSHVFWFVVVILMVGEMRGGESLTLEPIEQTAQPTRQSSRPMRDPVTKSERYLRNAPPPRYAHTQTHSDTHRHTHTHCSTQWTFEHSTSLCENKLEPSL